MVSLLGRDHGLGRSTLKFCLTKCYKKLRVKIHHYILLRQLKLCDIFPFLILKCHISRLFILELA